MNCVEAVSESLVSLTMLQVDLFDSNPQISAQQIIVATNIETTTRALHFVDKNTITNKPLGGLQFLTNVVAHQCAIKHGNPNELLSFYYCSLCKFDSCSAFLPTKQ
jgi:hypothetical protein